MIALIRLVVFGTTAVVFLVSLLYSSCEIKVPKPTACGDFDFETSTQTFLPPGKIYPGPGRVLLGFSFQPEKCGAAPCACQKVIFVQAIRFKLPPQIRKQPHDEQTERMTHSETPFFDGWAIDTQAHAIWPYYGMNDDGTFPFNPTVQDLFNLTPGSNRSRAVLRDTPFSTEWDTYSIEAISVPVCLDGDSACDHRILGYYTWGWDVPNKNRSEVLRFFHDPAATDLYVQAFDQAVQAWNSHLGGRRQPLQLSRLP